MNLTHINDFYYLQSIVLNAKEHEDSAMWLKIGEKAQELLDELTSLLSESIFAYLFIACMGEARHASSGKAASTFSPDLLRSDGEYPNRSEIFDKAVLYDPKQNIEPLCQLFDQPWAGSYGGKRWLTIAQSMKYYFDPNPKWTKIAFIDYVIDLHHNNGTVFSKSECSETIQFECEYVGSGGLDYILEHKKYEPNLLTWEPENRIYLSKRVYALVKRALGKDDIGLIEPIPLVYSAMQDWSWESIEWGDKVLKVEKKWSSWRNVFEYGNSPTKAELYELLPHITYSASVFKHFVDSNNVTPIIKQLKAEQEHYLEEMKKVYAGMGLQQGGFDVYVKAQKSDLATVCKAMKAQVASLKSKP